MTLWSWKGNRGPGRMLWQPTAGCMTHVTYGLSAPQSEISTLMALEAMGVPLPLDMCISDGQCLMLNLLVPSGTLASVADGVHRQDVPLHLTDSCQWSKLAARNGEKNHSWNEWHRHDETYRSRESNCIASSSFCLFMRPSGNIRRLTPVFSIAFVIAVTSVCGKRKGWPCIIHLSAGQCPGTHRLEVINFSP